MIIGDEAAGWKQNGLSSGDAKLLTTDFSFSSRSTSQLIAYALLGISRGKLKQVFWLTPEDFCLFVLEDPSDKNKSLRF